MLVLLFLVLNCLFVFFEAVNCWSSISVQLFVALSCLLGFDIIFLFFFSTFICLISFKSHFSAESSFPTETQCKQSILNFKKASLPKYLFTSESSLSFHLCHWLTLRTADANATLSHQGEDERSEGLLRLYEVSTAIPAPQVPC